MISVRGRKTLQGSPSHKLAVLLSGSRRVSLTFRNQGQFVVGLDRSVAMPDRVKQAMWRRGGLLRGGRAAWHANRALPEG